MSERRRPLIILPGGYGDRELKPLRFEIDSTTNFQTFSYPGWENFVPGGFSAPSLVAELTQRIEEWVPSGPIRIVGYSLGGHLGYVVALNLQARGREIAGFCVIDAAIKDHPFKKRLALIQEGHFRELFRSIKTGAQNTLLRTTRKVVPASPVTDSTPDALARLLRWLKDAWPWISSLDLDVVPLNAPSVLLRTWPTATADAAWRRRCPGIQIHTLPGTHDTVYEPQNARFMRDTIVAATRDWR